MVVFDAMYPYPEIVGRQRIEFDLSKIWIHFVREPIQFSDGVFWDIAFVDLLQLAYEEVGSLHLTGDGVPVPWLLKEDHCGLHGLEQVLFGRLVASFFDDL